MRLNRRWFLGHAVALPGTAAGTAPLAATRSDVAKRIDGALDKLRLFDSHEHLIPEKKRIEQTVGFFRLVSHCVINDVISAGLSGDALATVRDEHASTERRWAAFEPFWKATRFTGYGQTLAIAVKDIYGVEEISHSTIGHIDEAIRSRNKPGFYREVLRERTKIDWCVVDANWNEKPARLDQDFFLLSQKFDGFVTPSSRKDIDRLEGVSGVAIHSLADHKRALAVTFEQAIQAGMVAVKSTLAYNRDLKFEEVSEYDAGVEFERMLKGEIERPVGFRARKQRPLRALEDHMFHEVVRLADAHKFPIQIHTGLLAGNSCFVENVNPALLTNVFHLYPRVRFDLFHIGYPYQQDLGVLVKLFPNLYVNFCWAHIISAPGSRRTLDEYLETVPVNKIIGFGGDCRFPELTYAQAKITRNNVAQVLTAKVESGLFTEDQALDVGQMLLRENALQLYPPQRGAAA